MNETMKKLSEETRKNLAESVASDAVSKLIASTKAASDDDSGSFRVIVSTADTDRQGESVSQDGWDLAFYKANPVVLWAHDYSALPIGMCTSIEVKDGKLVAEGKFAPANANPFAQQVRRLYDLGMVNTTSVGFIPTECDYSREPAQIIKAELLEFSFVPIPANPYALRLSQIRDLNIDTAMLKIKGIEIKEEAEIVPPAPEVTPPAAPNSISEVTPETPAQPAPETTVPPTPPVTPPAESIPTPLPDDEIKAIRTSLERITVALEKHGLLEGAVDSKETQAATNRSKSSEALKELNSFVETRELLRLIDNAVGKALENFNRSARPTAKI